jgi:integrase
MSVRKRKWITSKGEAREAWIVHYSKDGNQHIKHFERKKDADAYHATVRVDIDRGVHTAPSRSPTVAKAAEDWLSFVESEERQRSTLVQYRQHVAHINKLLGSEKLGKLTTPRINVFRDELIKAVPTRQTAKKVLASLKGILKDAMRRGNVAQNVARDVSIEIKRGRDLKVGVDIPTPEEIRAIISMLKGRWRPLILTAIFTGLRASELRGLRWIDVDLKESKLHVRQRADAWNELGDPKSKSGERVVPIPPMLVNTLREWKLRCPKGELDLVFPNGKGNVENHANIIARGLIPTQIAAGVVNKEGKAKYTGLHALRHFYASWCINRRDDGGLELPAKNVQERLGHASIVITLDTYGHLFKSGDDGKELAAAEGRLWGIGTT